MKSLNSTLKESLFGDDYGVGYDIEDLAKFHDGQKPWTQVQEMFNLCIAAQPGSKKFKNIPAIAKQHFAYAMFLSKSRGGGLIVVSFNTKDYMIWYNFNHIDDIGYGEIDDGNWGRAMRDQIKTLNNYEHGDVYGITKETWVKMSDLFNNKFC